MWVVDVLIASAFSAFACLRVWAISSGRWMPCLTVFLLSAFGPAANIYNFSSVVFLIDDNGCSVLTTTIGPIIVRSTVVATDLVLVIVTWYKTSTLVRKLRRLGQGNGVATILFRNGLCLVVLTLMNIVSMILDIREIGAPDVSGLHVNTHLVSSIVISRFILDLRTAYTDETQETYSLGNQSIRFAANIGAPLDNSIVFAAGQETQFDDDWYSESTSPVVDSEEKYGESHMLKTFSEQA
ncbi:hypothetical protein K474DRAFT_1664572 [Panus rudis PR-1116 ss-1]|nr:hypothetical protein K474DRAFT_1664572 [Panus rudis PR-1116 ss-1]